MNYSDLIDVNNEDLINKINDIDINNNTAKTLLDDYKILKNSLTEYKNNFKNLINQKETYDNYINNLFNNHLNIINIINNDSNLNNSFIDYQKNIKENYDNWIKDIYQIKIKSIEENIENIEIKLKDFSYLFLFIINNIINNKEISKNMCPICFENEIDICLNPCGHTTCNLCVLSNRSNIYNNKCFTCRSPVNEYIKIYFSL
jgi:hypothetical protein